MGHFVEKFWRGANAHFLLDLEYLQYDENM